MTINEWLEQLAARGIQTRIVNGRLRHFPSTAYKQLTAADQDFIRANRAAIKDAVRGITSSASDIVTTQVMDYVQPEVMRQQHAEVRIEQPAQGRSDAESLAPEKWPSLGIYKVRGVVTHPLGDEHAQQILSGDIPFAEAQQQEQRRRRDFHGAGGTNSWG